MKTNGEHLYHYYLRHPTYTDRRSLVLDGGDDDPRRYVRWLFLRANPEGLVT